MEAGLLIMLIIIVITVAVVVAVFYYGTQHDAHTEMRSAESSRAVQTLQAQFSAAMDKLDIEPSPAPVAEAPTAEEPAAEADVEDAAGTPDAEPAEDDSKTT